MGLQEVLGVLATFIGSILLGMYLQDKRQKSASKLIDLKVDKDVSDAVNSAKSLHVSALVKYLNDRRRKGG